MCKIWNKDWKWEVKTQMKNVILGVELKEVERQCSLDSLKCDVNSPIMPFETLEPCIEGGKKILENEKLRNWFRRIYTGRESNE